MFDYFNAFLLSRFFFILQGLIETPEDVHAHRRDQVLFQSQDIAQQPPVFSLILSPFLVDTGKEDTAIFPRKRLSMRVTSRSRALF